MSTVARPVEFGFMFFAASEDALAGTGYDLVIRSARYADENGFSSVWVPERHFTPFGCLYPNPAVLQAALARETRRIRLQAGSVVLPLHDPLRVAEEWSMVDNLSGGRVGLSVASGWNPNDFAFFPERYASRHDELFRGLETLRRLWRGEAVPARSGTGDRIDVRIYPKPVQPELPVWITAAGNPETFVRAGESGANLLTHLLDHDPQQLAGKIALYREARRRSGHNPEAGRVSLMLHTFVGEDLDQVRGIVREPYCQYLKENALPLLRELAISRGRALDAATMSPPDLDEFAGFLFERFLSTRSLMGTVESCLPLIAELERSGVDEIACLLDFGPSAENVLAHLPFLKQLMVRAQQESGVPREPSLPVSPVPAIADQEDLSLSAVRARCVQRMDGDEFYLRLSDRGVDLTEGFRGIVSLWRRDGEALARIQVQQEWSRLHRFPPELLDACFQAVAGALPDATGDALYLPAGLRRFEILDALPAEVWSHVELTSSGRAGEFTASVRILNADEQVVARVHGLRLKPASAAGLDRGRLPVYTVAWHPQPLPHDPVRDIRGTWIVTGELSDLTTGFVRSIETRGASVVDALSVHAVAELPDVDCIRGLTDLRGVVFFPLMTGVDFSRSKVAEVAAAYRSVTSSLLATVRALIDAGVSPRIWIAAPAGDGSPLFAVLSSMMRSLGLEHPGMAGGVLDPGVADLGLVDRILDELTRGPYGEEVRWSRGVREVARLDAAALEPSPAGLRAEASYLITGGTGGLGLEVAAWMIRAGARHVVLVARRPPGPEVVRRIDELQSGGARIRVECVDVASETGMQSVLDRVREELPPLRGVVHAAGVLDDALWRNQTAEKFDNVRTAKVDGAWNLHCLTRTEPLDFFVMFSSGATIVPTEGQANYIAANAFLDGLAAFRRDAGLPAASVGWGPWAHVGHASTSYGRAAHQRLAQRGIDAIEPAEALDALAGLLRGSAGHVTAFRADWPKLLSSGVTLPLLERFHGSASDSDASSDLLKRISDAPEESRTSVLVEHVRDEIARVMGMTGASAVDSNRGLFDLGMDSVTALELKTRLQRAVGKTLPSTLVFDHPTATRITGFLFDLIYGSDRQPVRPPAEATTAAANVSEIEAMSEEEAEARLLEKLAALGMNSGSRGHSE